MAYDVTQWLAEIKSLQRQLAETQKERDTAFASAANWRKLYETEAQQRRLETRSWDEKLQSMERENQRLQGEFAWKDADIENLRTEVDALKTPEALREKLLEALLLSERLSQALQKEQAEHAKTRNNLTAALGDAIDMLSRDQVAVKSGADSLPPQNA